MPQHKFTEETQLRVLHRTRGQSLQLNREAIQSSGPAGFVTNIGTQNIQGIAARGFRWSGREAGRFKDEWISEDLDADILIVTTDQAKWKLANIRREEPDPKLFRIPPDYKIALCDEHPGPDHVIHCGDPTTPDSAQAPSP